MHSKHIARGMAEQQVEEYWAALAQEYEETYSDGSASVVYNALLEIAIAHPEKYRGAVAAAANAVAKRFCTLGPTCPQALPEIRDLAERQAAARAHPGLSGVHLADVIASIDLEVIRGRHDPVLMNNLRNQACYDASIALNATGRGVQVQRRECFTQACRAIWPGNGPVPEDIIAALSL